MAGEAKGWCRRAEGMGGICSTIRERMLQMPGDGARQQKTKVKLKVSTKVKNLLDRVENR
jgi:hypothetical protein